MLGLPQSTEFNRRLPKQKFYDNLDVPAEIRRAFIDQIKVIYWASKLSAQSMNVAPGENVDEIEVIQIVLHGDDLDHKVLTLMDRQIPYHILFVLERPDGKQQLVIRYKEATQSGDNAFQVRSEYFSEWLPPDEIHLSFNSLDMDGMYESIVRQIAGTELSSSREESLREAVDRAQQVERITKEITRLEKQARSEKQPKKKLELVKQIKALQQELSE